MTSNVAPGQPVPILVNHFKMRMQNSGKIYMYSVAWGPEVDSSDSKQCMKAYRSIKNELERVFGVFIPRMTALYSPTMLE